MSPNSARSVGVEVDHEPVRDEGPIRRRQALALHRSFDPTLQLDRLEARAEEASRRALEQAFEEPLDGGEWRHGRSRSLPEGPRKAWSAARRTLTFGAAGRYPRWKGALEPCDILSTRFGRHRRPERCLAAPGDPMTEILTESFCERCGTRYTFESRAPESAAEGRQGPVARAQELRPVRRHVDGRGDGRRARSETERELTANQLDAFHKTFNFCMSCRQYTCANCWNEAEGRCLTCAPHLGHEILPAPFPDLSAPSFLSPDGLHDGTNGSHDGAGAANGFARSPRPRLLPPRDRASALRPTTDVDVAARLDALTDGAGRRRAAVPERGLGGRTTEPEVVVVEVEPEPVAVAEIEAIAATAEPVTEPEPMARGRAEARARARPSPSRWRRPSPSRSRPRAETVADARADRPRGRHRAGRDDRRRPRRRRDRAPTR